MWNEKQVQFEHNRTLLGGTSTGKNDEKYTGNWKTWQENIEIGGRADIHYIIMRKENDFCLFVLCCTPASGRKSQNVMCNLNLVQDYIVI